MKLRKTKTKEKAEEKHMSFLAGLGNLDWGGIDLLQRILLVTDGTLTDILQVAFREPIGVRKLDPDIADMSVEALELQPGETRMDRSVVLYGQKTGTNYVYADSTLVVERLPKKLQDELLNSDKPIGRLWSQHKVEVRKEMLHVSKCSPARLLPHFKYMTENEQLFRRSYRLITSGRPVIIITEYFPSGLLGDGVSRSSFRDTSSLIQSGAVLQMP
ncbi:MAG TPA: chorismate pyruvate-lyase family protein [Candidatus Angelobacter sp.]|nr:chorismate pyruvate-lyase family protein [Candidatus Angelobacter sp.]